MKNPEIRFEKDKKDWNNKCLKNIVKYQNKSKLPASIAKEYGKYRFFRSDSSNIPAYSDIKLANCAAIIMNDGGQCDFKYYNGPFAYSDHCICFSFEENNNYLYQWLLLNKDIINRDGFVGCALKNIDRAYFNNLLIPIPPLDIQDKISALFSDIDTKIENETKLIEKLNVMKKSMLERLFPQENDKVPAIRFSGFTDDWEQCKLKEVASRVQGNDGRMNLPTLTISAANGWMAQEDRFSGNIAGKEQNNYTLLHKKELSYNHGNSKLAKYGTVFSLQTYKEALVPRVYHSFKIHTGNADFIEYYFATKIPDRELGKLITSGARMDGLLNISFDSFMGINMWFPKTEEQEKISEFFRKIDNLITLHQRKLHKYEHIKLALLEKMIT